MYQRILVVMNERPEAQAAAAQGIELARVHGAELMFLSVLPRVIETVAELTPMVPVLPTDDVDRELRRRAESLLARASAQAAECGVLNRTIVRKEGDAVACIASLARELNCDLIVAGAEPRNAVMRILSGSLIPGLITQTPVPLLVCHATACAKVDILAG